MRVGLDATSLGNHTTGVGRYIRNVGIALAAAPDLQPSIYVRRGVLHPWPASVVHVGPWRDSVGSRVALGTVAWPLLSRRHRLDLFHSPGYFLPFGLGIPGLVTLHDMRSFYEGLCPRPRQMYLRSTLANTARRARRIVTVSEFSRSEIVRFLHVDPDRIDVTYLAPDERFAAAIPDADVLRATCKHRIRRPYVFAVGYIEPRKNYSNLVRAVALLRQAGIDCDLVIAGSALIGIGELQRVIAATGMEAHTRLLGYVPDKDLPALYRGAAVATFVSTYEGFGIPAIEAMSASVPLVISDVGALPEVCGDAALVADPHAPESICEAIGRLMSSAALAAEYIGRGNQHLQRYQWRYTAAATIQAYRKALE